MWIYEFVQSIDVYFLKKLEDVKMCYWILEIPIYEIKYLKYLFMKINLF